MARPLRVEYPGAFYHVINRGVDVNILQNPNRMVTEGFILGDSDFINWIKGNFLSDRQDEKEIPQLKKLKPRVPLKTVANAVCEEFGCNEEQIITIGPIFFRIFTD